MPSKRVFSAVPVLTYINEIKAGIAFYFHFKIDYTIYFKVYVKVNEFLLPLNANNLLTFFNILITPVHRNRKESVKNITLRFYLYMQSRIIEKPYF